MKASNKYFHTFHRDFRNWQTRGACDSSSTYQLVCSRLAACTLVLIAAFSSNPAVAETYQNLQERRPELFHAQTGFRIDRQRAPTPDDIPPPARIAGTQEVLRLLSQGALALDVFGAAQSRYDELDGKWLVSKPRMSIPGAVWLPETGRGVLDDEMQAYLTSNLELYTGANLDKAIIVFCVADCWMSWNAAQRIADLGYRNVYWYRLGTDGWVEDGHTLEMVDPVPVNIE